MTAPEIVVHIAPQVRISSMSVFEIGSNKTCINHGLMQHELLTLSSHIRDMISYFKQKHPEGKVGLAVAGYVLDQLKETDEGTLARLQRFAQQPYVSILAVPYYGSSLHVLHSDELRAQITLEHEALKKYFGKRPEHFFSKDSLNLAQEKVLRPRRYKTIVSNAEPSKDSVPLLKRESAVLMDITNFSAGEELARLVNLEPESIQQQFTETENHVKEELLGLYTYVNATGDRQLLQDWRLLAQSDIIRSVGDTHKDQNQTYENYMHLLNIFNDVAHRIRSVELSKRGDFLSQPEIVNSPSQLLKDLM